MNKANHKYTKNLDELLSKSQSGSEDLDAFEQDALEGFAMLKNTEEAKALKEATDARFKREVMSESKGTLTIRLFWSAAAGIALLIGLVVVFKVYQPLDKPEMAQTMQPAIENEADQLERVSDMNEQVPEEKTTEKLVSPAAPLTQNQKQFAEPITQTGKADETADLKMEENANTRNIEQAGSKADEDAKPLDDNLSRTAPAKDAMGGGVPKTDSKAQYDREEEKESKKVEGFASAKAKKAAKETQSPAGVNEISAAESAAPPASTSALQSAYLTISEKEFKNKLESFMQNKSYKQSFSCIIKLSENGDIKDIMFTNNKQFNRNQEKEITNFLKDLKCFASPNGSKVSYYTVNYTLP
jgi:hypothetical protein